MPQGNHNTSKNLHMYSHQKNLPLLHCVGTVIQVFLQNKHYVRYLEASIVGCNFKFNNIPQGETLTVGIRNSVLLEALDTG